MKSKIKISQPEVLMRSTISGFDLLLVAGMELF
jgi:hypothetical protein